MSLVSIPILAIVFGVGLTAMAVAAGNGAGAGGSGRQRAINSGLPPGDPGPLGSSNNPRPAAAAPAAERTSPHADPSKAQ